MHVMDGLDDNQFKCMFRVDRQTFHEILDSISPIMVERNAVKASNSSGSPITSKTRLAVMLGWLAGASHIDLCFCWGISIGTFYNKDRGPIWPTREAINLAFDIGLPLHDASQLDELAKGFYYHSGDILDGCVITVDGLAAHPQQPYDYKVWKEDYRFRKGGLTIIVIAGCDVDCYFVVVSCKHSGSW
jgi:hypothetical protein